MISQVSLCVGRFSNSQGMTGPSGSAGFDELPPGQQLGFPDVVDLIAHAIGLFRFSFLPGEWCTVPTLLGSIVSIAR